MLSTLLSVALGGAIGASGRFLVGQAALRILGPTFPWGTLLVNAVGSFAMGVLVVLLTQSGNERLNPFLLTGVLGGFTTFSAFSLDAVTLYERGQATLAGGYVLASVFLSIGGLVLGFWLARSLAA